MSKQHIASALFQCKKKMSFFTYIQGELYTVTELLSMYFGRDVLEDEAMTFLTHKSHV